MADSTLKHQVIIVGGGITGLTLALGLQRLNIDYVLLEAYGSVTPDKGASIILNPNGLRVLDQLGVIEDLRPHMIPGTIVQMRNGEIGKQMYGIEVNSFMEKRHGYAPTFSMRHRLVSILYTHVQEKQRLLVNKKVIRIENTPDRALVHVEDGSVYEAQLVVGADGVHSTVRSEMWRNADASDLAIIPKQDRRNVRNEYGCIFSSSKDTENKYDAFPLGHISIVSATDMCFLIGKGTNGEASIYYAWVLPKSQRECPIDQITRLTKEEEKAALDNIGDLVTTDDGVRARDLFDDPKSSGCTTLPCYTLQRWGYGRIVIIGDAAHKPNPITGQGGNSCIESCASLLNALQDHLSPKFAEEPVWPINSLTEALRALERDRVERVTKIVEEGQDKAKSMSWRTSWDRVMQKHIAPFLPQSVLAKPASTIAVSSVLLRGIFKKPNYTAEWLYDDEKPPRPQVPLLGISTVTLGLGLATIYGTKLYKPVIMGLLAQ